MTAAAAIPSARSGRVDPGLLAWCGAIAFTVLCLALKARLPWLVTFPKDWVLPIASGVNAVSDAVVPPSVFSITIALNVPTRASSR